MTTVTEVQDVRDIVRANIEANSAWDTPYLLMNVLATLIACYGLLESSAADRLFQLCCEESLFLPPRVTPRADQERTAGRCLCKPATPPEPHTASFLARFRFI
jgi:hypothetical protein